MAEYATKEQAVRNLQRYLRRLSYEEPSISAPPIDGIFELQTAEALSEFQRLFGLPVTGRSDRATHDALFEEYSRLVRQNDTQIEPRFFPSVPPDYVTTSGESHAFIVILQWLLNELRVLYDDLPSLTLSGVMDQNTEEAVRRYQVIHGLSPTGQVNRALWSLLSLDFNQYGGGQ